MKSLEITMFRGFFYLPSNTNTPSNVIHVIKNARVLKRRKTPDCCKNVIKIYERDIKRLKRIRRKT
jgi:hypothetical protein